MFHYFVSFVFQDTSDPDYAGYGNCGIELPVPITSMEQISSISKSLVENIPASVNLTIMNYILLKVDSTEA